jgi:hypothetical protein
MALLSPALFGSLLHSGFHKGTVCTKEARFNGRLHPKFGSFLFLVDSFQLGEERFSINRMLDTDRLATVSNQTLKESRLIVEFSVMYDVPPEGVVLSSNPEWNDMIPHLIPNQECVDHLMINKLMRLDLHIPPSLPSKTVCKGGCCRMESREETRSRFTRLDQAKGILSFILKSRATEMSSVTVLGDYSPAMISHAKEGSIQLSANHGREVLLGGMEKSGQVISKRLLSTAM